MPAHKRFFFRAACKAMPHMFCSYKLEQMWMYKYDSFLKSGIENHADPAVVNVNIWLTPDSALEAGSEAKEAAGLVVYTVRPPKEWPFELYNGPEGRDLVRRLLEESCYANVTVPYAQNRAVIFDSALLHHSGKIRFKPGYANRRINLTLLFGRRGDTCKLPKGVPPLTKKDLQKCAKDVVRPGSQPVKDRQEL